MKRWTSAVVLAAALGAPGAAPAWAQAVSTSAEEEAVREALGHYLAAHATGVGEHIGLVFHPDATLYWVADGQLMRRAGTEYQAGFRGTAPADEAERSRWIEMVDVTGNVAVAKVILDYPGAHFTDYFALIKVDGEWRVMTKLFHRGPPSTSP